MKHPRLFAPAHLVARSPRPRTYAALFLASDEANSITGTELVVDGGLTVRCA